MKASNLRQNLLATALITACTSIASHAATLHWDGTDTTADADGGAGTWDSSTTNWDDAATAGVATAWTSGDSAIFGGTAGSVTVVGNLQAASITVNGGYTFGGTASDSINLGGGSIDSSGTTGAATDVNLNTIITGTGGLTIKAHGDLSPTGGGSGAEFRLGGANTFSGGLNITGGLVSWTTDAGLGDVANTITLSNFGGLLFTGTSTSMARNVVIDSTGGTFRTYGASTLTLSGQISGSGNVNRTDGGTLILSNSANSQSGTWNNQSGIIRINGGGSLGTSIINNTATFDFFNDGTAATFNNTINGNGTVRFESSTGTAYNGTLSGASNVIVGDITNGAILNLTSGATIDTGNLYLGETSGVAGNIIQGAGTAVTVSNQLRIGHWANNVSTYTLNDGTLDLTGTPGAGFETAGVIMLGIDGTGIFNQNGGTVTTPGVGLDVRSDTAGTDQYNLNGGTLIVGSKGIDGFGSSEFNLGGGTLQAGSNFTSTKSWNVNSASTLELDGYDVTQSGNIVGTGTLLISDGFSTGTKSLILSGSNQTVSAPISGVENVYYAGTGTLNWSSASTLTGRIDIAGGATLNLTGSTDGDVDLFNGSTITGEGTIGGNLTLDDTLGTETYTLRFNPATEPAALGITGDFDTGVGTTINVALAQNIPVSATPETYTVLTYGSALGDKNFVLSGASGFRGASLTAGANALTLDIHTKDLTWATGAGWDLGSTGAWDDGTTATDTFYNGDEVTFDDSATSTSINITGSLAPAKVTVNSSTNAFSINGNATNRITGTGSLLKDGSSSLTISGSHNYSGGTTISEGSIIFTGAQDNGLGSGAITLGDANTGSSAVSLLITNGRQINNAITVSSLASGAATIGFSGTGGSYTAFNGSIALQRDVTLLAGTTDRLHFGGNISGTGNLTISGGRRITMSGNNSFVGNITIDGANTLFQTFGGNPVPDTAQVNVGAGSIFQVFTSETIGTLTGSGILRPIAGKPTLTIAGNADATYSGTWVNDVSDHVNITKNGASVQTFSGNFTSPGALTINGGTVAISGTAEFGRTFAPGTALPTRGVNGAGTLRADSGANLTLRRSGAEFTGALQVNSGATVTLGHNNALGTGSVALQGGTLRFDNSGAYFTPIAGLIMTGGTLTTDVTTANFGTLHNTTGDVVPGSTTHVYHGQIYLTAGEWSFAKRFDDAGSVTINGTTIVNDTVWNATATGSFTAPADGWYTMDIRVQQGGGGVGPNGAGWTSGIGIKQGSPSTVGTDYVALTDGALGTRIVTSNNITFARGIAVNSASTINTANLVGTPGTTGTDGNGTGGDLTLTAAITGSANLTKTGTGSMFVNASSNGYTGSFVVNGGSLVIQNAILGSAGITVNAGARLVTNSTNFFVAGHGTAVNASRVITVNGGTWLMDAGHDARIGNVTLSNSATWTSNRGLSNYDALLANTNLGAATVNVTGTGASTMNGTGGIHLQGVQNFNVANTTSDASADLVVDMILGAQGTIGGDAGGVRKQGDGTMLLNKTNTYTGSTIVEAGTLGGTGSIVGSLVSSAGSTVAPGASIGTFTVNNSATLGGSLAIEVDGETADVLVVTGALDISGATLDITELGGGITAPALVIATYGSLTGPAFASVTGLPTGYTVDYAYDNGINTNNIAIVFSTTPYGSYEAANNIVGDGAEADSDGDGIANGLEFVLGGISDPALGSNDRGKLPQLLASGTVPAGALALLPEGKTEADYIFFEYRLADDAAGEDIEVQYGSALSAWSPAATGVNGVVTFVEDDGFDTAIDRVIVCIPRDITGNAQRLFTRLQVLIP